MNRLPPAGWPPGFVVSASAANRGLTQQKTVAPQLQVGVSPAVPVIRLSRRRAANVVIIGVDAHKTQHTASAVEAGTQQVLGTVEIEAGLPGDRRLLRWAQRYQSRRRAVENAHGLGRHLAPWLVAVVRLSATSSTATARVRKLSRGGRRKNDVIDAAAAACAAALVGDGLPVAAEDASTVLATLDERRGKRGRTTHPADQPAPRPAPGPGARWRPG